MRYVTALILSITFCVSLSAGIGDPDPGGARQPVPTGRWWLFLEPPDGDPAGIERQRREAARQLSPRSLQRRSKVIRHDPPVRLCDLPPTDDRLDRIRLTGCKIVTIARYLNAVSVEGDPAALELAGKLKFVREIRPVMALPTLNQDVVATEDPPDLMERPGRDDPEDYGTSYRQAELVNLPAAHDAGYSGHGVLIGVQDTGFNLGHRCYESLDLLATWDFVNGDENVGDENDHGRGSHGTRTLSVIAGLDSGFFIGAAPGAQFVLTKTENSESETPVEEDHWVAGLWFHDSIGVDVLSSSVSYRNWYDYSDMDGETAVTTRAADSAAAAGIVIVNSVGNTGRQQYPDTKIGAPADGDMVIGVGGVYTDSSHWGNSSQGPTFDGRIKPDVVALSSRVKVASTVDDESYPNSSGTSFSCPMIAGIAALMLEAEPRLTPQEVIDILRETASLADDPDTLMGYGIVDALAAVRRAEEASVPGDNWRPQVNSVNGFSLIGYPNPTNGSISFVLPMSGFSRVELLNLTGAPVREFDLRGHTGGAVVELNLSDLPSGDYLIRVSSADEGEKTLTGRLTLQK